jgi:hypothetical protein
MPRARKMPESGVYMRLVPYTCAAAMAERPPAIQEARPLLAIVLHAVRHQKLCGIPYRSRAA